MKRYIFIILMAVSGMYFSSCTKEQLQQAASTISNDSLSDADVVSGLKTALQVGTDTSVNLTHRVNGYFGNQAIKILFPPNAQKVVDAVSKIPGGQAYIDKVVLSLNRAAEDAATEAKPIFINAITSMTITEGKNILFGDSLAATSYLKTKTFTDLKSAFQPKIKASLDKVSATQYWTDIMTVYNLIPGVDKVDTDLPSYTTGKALDGLFYMVGREEKDIRKDPAARVTDILKKVFGKLDKH